MSNIYPNQNFPGLDGPRLIELNQSITRRIAIGYESIANVFQRHAQEIDHRISTKSFETSKAAYDAAVAQSKAMLGELKGQVEEAFKNTYNALDETFKQIIEAFQDGAERREKELEENKSVLATMDIRLKTVEQNTYNLNGRMLVQEKKEVLPNKKEKKLEEAKKVDETEIVEVDKLDGEGSNATFTLRVERNSFLFSKLAKPLSEENKGKIAKKHTVLFNKGKTNNNKIVFSVVAESEELEYGFEEYAKKLFNKARKQFNPNKAKGLMRKDNLYSLVWVDSQLQFTPVSNTPKVQESKKCYFVCEEDKFLLIDFGKVSRGGKNKKPQGNKQVFQKKKNNNWNNKYNFKKNYINKKYVGNQNQNRSPKQQRNYGTQQVKSFRNKEYSRLNKSLSREVSHMRKDVKELKNKVSKEDIVGGIKAVVTAIKNSVFP